MNKEQLIQLIAEQYNVDEEHPWMKYPGYAVFRHRGNRKWFALLMSIPQNKLGLAGSGLTDVLNVKCDPILMGSLRKEPGVYPAYHMDKGHWITIALDGNISDDKIKWLLDLSYELTGSKKKPQ